MTLANFVAGLLLIQAEHPDAEICATHDQFFAGPDADTTPETAKKLEELGWFRDMDSWSAFT